MQDPEIPRWALDNRRCHVKGHRSAQRDLQGAVRPDCSIRGPTDATGRTEHQWVVDRADCYLRDGTWKSSNSNRSKARGSRDSWTALMAAIRRSTGLDIVLPRKKCHTSKAFQTNKDSKTEQLGAARIWLRSLYACSPSPAAGLECAACFTLSDRTRTTSQLSRTTHGKLVCFHACKVQSC
jgi:hypothetical protein